MSTTWTAAQLTETFIKLRDRKKALEAKHKDELRPIVDAMDQLEIMAMQHLQGNQMTSMATESGTVYLVTRRNYKIENREEFRAWCEANGRTDFFEARPAKGTIDEYVEAGNALPPGLGTTADIAAQFRK